MEQVYDSTYWKYHLVRAFRSAEVLMGGYGGRRFIAETESLVPEKSHVSLCQ